MKTKLLMIVLIGLSHSALANEEQDINKDFTPAYQEELRQGKALSEQPVREIESVEWKRHKEILSYIDRHDRD